MVVDPLFINASIDDKVADFHLKPGSPAIGRGIAMPFVPFLDLDSNQRAIQPSEGAYEK